MILRSVHLALSHVSFRRFSLELEQKSGVSSVLSLEMLIGIQSMYDENFRSQEKL